MTKKDKYRGINLSIGILIALAAVFITFEWSTEKISPIVFPDNPETQVWEVDYVPVPILERQKEKQAMKIPKHLTLINFEVVPDFEEMIDDPLDVSDSPIPEDIIFELPDDYSDVIDDTPMLFVQNMPKFPGGEEALMKFLNKTIKYPIIAQENGVQGRVYVNFIIEKDGSVTNVKITRGNDKSLNDEAIRVVKLMPKWIPGNQHTKNVRVRMNLPINFVLQ